MIESARKFDHRVNNPDPQIVAMLAAIDEIKGAFRVGIHLTPNTITHLRKSVLVTSAGASTRIEGSKLSDDEVKEIMQGLALSKFADRDSQEVQGYLETLQNVFNSYQLLPMRESTILSLHQELLKYSNKDDLHRGGYKHKENIVGVVDSSGQIARIIFETTPAYLTPSQMAELVEWTHEALLKERFHPLLIIANFLIEFLKIHPFEDGNGRLSRVLTNLLLLRSNYQFVQYISHEQLVEQRKDEYYLALRRSQETFTSSNDTISPWLNFFLSIIKQQATQALALIELEHEDGLSLKQMMVLEYFSTTNMASPKEVMQATGILMPTVRKSLERLVQMRKLRRVGHGRSTRYIKTN